MWLLVRSCQTVSWKAFMNEQSSVPGVHNQDEKGSNLYQCDYTLSDTYVPYLTFKTGKRST